MFKILINQYYKRSPLYSIWHITNIERLNTGIFILLNKLLVSNLFNQTYQFRSYHQKQEFVGLTRRFLYWPYLQ